MIMFLVHFVFARVPFQRNLGFYFNVWVLGGFVAWSLVDTTCGIIKKSYNGIIIARGKNWNIIKILIDFY